MSEIKFVEKIKTDILCLMSFYRKSYHQRENVEKCGARLHRIFPQTPVKYGACALHAG
jgi:hypothetical protein